MTPDLAGTDAGHEFQKATITSIPRPMSRLPRQRKESAPYAAAMASWAKPYAFMQIVHTLVHLRALAKWRDKFWSESHEQVRMSNLVSDARRAAATIPDDVDSYRAAEIWSRHFELDQPVAGRWYMR